MDNFMADNDARLVEQTAKFDAALAAVLQGSPSPHTFHNVAFSISPVMEDITMVTILTRDDENSPWNPPEEEAPADVDSALRANGFDEEGENGFTINRSTEAVIQLLTSWGLLQEDFEY
jgi:hypothetical protein